MGYKAAAALAVSIALTAACEVQRTPRPQVLNVDSARAAEIEATLDQYTDALLAGNARGSAALFTADARLLSSDGVELAGSGSIRDMLRESLGDATVTAASMDREVIDMVGDSTAYEIGTFSESYRADDAAEETVSGHYMIRWRRGPESTWRIQTMMLSHVAPAAVDSTAAVDSAAAATDR